jgi:hypothetical protein
MSWGGCTRTTRESRRSFRPTSCASWQARRATIDRQRLGRRRSPRPRSPWRGSAMPADESRPLELRQSGQARRWPRRSRLRRPGQQRSFPPRPSQPMLLRQAGPHPSHSRRAEGAPCCRFPHRRNCRSRDRAAGQCLLRTILERSPARLRSRPADGCRSRGLPATPLNSGLVKPIPARQSATPWTSPSTTSRA